MFYHTSSDVYILNFYSIYKYEHNYNSMVHRLLNIPLWEKNLNTELNITKQLIMVTTY